MKNRAARGDDIYVSASVTACTAKEQTPCLRLETANFSREHTAPGQPGKQRGPRATPPCQLGNSIDKIRPTVIRSPVPNVQAKTSFIGKLLRPA